MDNKFLAIRNKSMIARTKSRQGNQNMKTLGITNPKYNERGERKRERYQKASEKGRDLYHKARRRGANNQRTRRRRRR